VEAKDMWEEAKQGEQGRLSRGRVHRLSRREALPRR